MKRLPFVLLLPPLLLSQTPEEVARKAEAKLHSYRSLQADFEHIYYSATVSTPLIEKGRLYLQKPDLMKWEYTKPEKKTFLIRDRLFESYFPEDNQLTRSFLDEEGIESEVLALIAGQKKITENYQVEFSPFAADNSKTWQLKLTPKNEGNDSYLILKINEKTGLIEKLLSFDWSGNKQEFCFSQIKTNLTFPKDTFELKVPPGVEIIEDIKR